MLPEVTWSSGLGRSCKKGKISGLLREGREERGERERGGGATHVDDNLVEGDRRSPLKLDPRALETVVTVRKKRKRSAPALQCQRKGKKDSRAPFVDILP
jgi:hypothetical protein